MSDKSYSVYSIVERSTDKIFYVGLTRLTLNRRFNHHVRRRKISPKDYAIRLIQEELTLEQACALEEMLILQYGTNIEGWNKVVRVKNGSSHDHSKEQITNWQEQRENESKPILNWFDRTGKPLSDQHKERIRAARLGNGPTKVICLNNGKVYSSMKTAGKELGLDHQKISQVVKGNRPHTKGFMFKRV